ncbi:MAG: hypothetical protein ACP5XB_20275 [Isosphaeraceae bacterium]
MVRRLVTIALSFGLVLTVGLPQTGSALAQETKKGVAAPKPEPPQTEAKKEAKAAPAKKEEAAKKEPAKALETPPPTIPKEVEEKLEKARHAVAEAIVAAQDAGLVDSSIDPPPILDILIQGYAIDAKTLKNPNAKNKYWAVSPEVFCGWFTGYGKLDGTTITPMTDIRIINPSAGLKAMYDQRANILNKHIEEVRKAKGQTKPAKPAETKPAPKPAEAKPAPKPAEAKPAPKPAEAKPAPKPAAEAKKK